MPLTKITLKPGFNNEVTNYANEGGYNSGNLVRFRAGYAEKIGGWANTHYAANPVSPASYSFEGVTNSLANWVSYKGENLIAFGTTRGYYVQDGIGTPYHDITPLSLGQPVANPVANPFMTVSAGSPIVTVSFVSHDLTVGSRVYFYITDTSSPPNPLASVTVGGATITAGVQTTVGARSYEVINVIDDDNYQIIADTPATSIAAGGQVVTATQLVNCSSQVTVPTYGWGLGPWGLGPWGIGSSTAITYSKRLWSQANFGEDLILAIQGGPIYYWTKDTATYAPAIPLADYATTQQFQTVTTVGSVSSSTTFTVQFNDYVYPGEFISFNGAAPPGGFIPAGTYIISVVGLQVTVNNPVTIPTGSVLNVSYSGQFVPTQTNKIFESPTYQFTIALGANPYDPINPNTAFNPLLVRWSDQTVPSQWIPLPSNQAGEQPLGNGAKIVTAVNNLQVILIFTDTALYQMQYIGAPYVFSFTLLQENISIISQNAAITANNVTWWMGTDKFYTYGGITQAIPCTVRRFVYSDLNKDAAWQIVAGYNEGFNEIWWFYPSRNSTVNDSYVKFNFVDNVWDTGRLNRTAWLGTALQNYPMAAYSTQATYLTAQISSGTVTLPVADSTSFPPSGTLTIGTEIITYTGNTGTSFTGCARGAYGSGAASADAYAPVQSLVPNQIMYHEYLLDDYTIPGVVLPVASYIQSSDFGVGDGHNFSSVWRIVPDLTFTNSGLNPQVTLTLLPRVNSGSPYQQGVDEPVVKNQKTFGTTSMYPIEQFTGQVYTRIRGRQMSFRIDTGNLSDPTLIYGQPASARGVMWQLGNMRMDVRPDGRR